MYLPEYKNMELPEYLKWISKEERTDLYHAVLRELAETFAGYDLVKDYKNALRRIKRDPVWAMETLIRPFNAVFFWEQHGDGRKDRDVVTDYVEAGKHKEAIHYMVTVLLQQGWLPLKYAHLKWMGTQWEGQDPMTWVPGKRNA